MSTIAGYRSLNGRQSSVKFLPMVGTAVGMIQPANVLVIGTGVADRGRGYGQRLELWSTLRISDAQSSPKPGR